MGPEVLFPIITALAILASSILTAGSFLKYSVGITKHFGYVSRGRVKLMWLTIATVYILSETLMGYGAELLFEHLAIGASMTTLFLDFLDCSLTLYGIGASLMQTVPLLPMINTDKTVAFALTLGLFLLSVLGLNAIYSWYPQDSGLILRTIEISGFGIAYSVIELLI